MSSLPEVATGDRLGVSTTEETETVNAVVTLAVLALLVSVAFSVTSMA
ncbi:unnamed protein product [Pararhodospirillum photometricum DSM 122]|uniref:Uncharacterized protein n=1 Tax=Pararhodospirillum photometricum DSM 122 TaxID=1150469 RepID=H6SQ60_PARPM|nr:unnamed protein product [Pararhodospirillum photometricum DSM 122]